MKAMYIISLLVFFQVLLGIKSTTPVSPAQDLVQAAFTSVKNLKQDFENVKLKREREFRNRLTEVVNAAYEELFKSLENEFFKPEDAKAISLIEGLKDTPDQSCVTRLRDFINDIKNKEGRLEYRNCAYALEAEAGQAREKLQAAQENINTRFTEAEQKIQACQRIYNLRGNITQLTKCVQVDAQVNLKKVPAALDDSLKSLTVQQLVTGVANCIDKTILVIKKSLNTNYDQIQRCLSTSNSNLAKQISAILPSYKYIVSSNVANEVTVALSTLKAKPNVTLENSVTIKIKVDQTITRRNRNTDNIKILLASNANVIKYVSALSNASIELELYSDARSCVNDAQSKFRDTMNARADDVKRCLDGIRQTVSVGDVTSLENNVVDRQRGEAQVAIVLCISSSGTLVQNNIVDCSAQADLAFENYLLSVDQKLNEASQKAAVISAQIDSCEKSVVPSILSALATNKFKFEACVLSRIYLNYTLQYE